MPFQIIIRTGFQLYKLDVVHFKGELFEHFKIYNPKSPDNYIFLQSNRPLLREKLKLKYRRIDWEVKEGEIRNIRMVEEAQKQIEAWLKKQGWE